MRSNASSTIVEPFHLQTPLGRRFGIYRGPGPDAECRAAYVHVPAFAEEMNKARRMTAVQARRLAEQGIATVHIDLYGTGDSDGEFSDARWEYWLDDVVSAADWLRSRTGASVGLWGLRLGALLAAQIAHEGRMRPSMMILWQPVTNGELFLTQFLRLKVASEMLAGDVVSVDTRRLREGLYGGQTAEIGGYDIAPELAMRLDALRIADFAPPVRCSWLEISASPSAVLSPASKKVIGGWNERGAEVFAQTVCGEPFWSSVEITECAALIEQTTTFCVEA